MSEKKESNAFFWGFVLGAAAGAVMMLLKTPRSGKETIGEIRARGQQLRLRGEDFAGKTTSQMNDLAQSAQTEMDKAQSQVSDLADQAVEQVQEAGEAAAAQVDQAVDAATS